MNVRLGEYDVSFSGADCVQVEGGGTDCTDPVITIPIERTIPHQNYNPASKLRRNDIALLRLAKMAPYTGEGFNSTTRYCSKPSYSLWPFSAKTGLFRLKAFEWLIIPVST